MTSFRNTDGRSDLYARVERERDCERERERDRDREREREKETERGGEECKRKRYMHAAIIRVPNRSRRPITRNRCVYIQNVPNGQAHGHH